MERKSICEKWRKATAVEFDLIMPSGSKEHFHHRLLFGKK